MAASAPTSTPVKPGTTGQQHVDPLDSAQSPWVTIVWDDPVNLMSYVTHVFVTYFKFDKPKAHKLMMQVHTEGRAVVASGTREEMEQHVNAMHAYGLWATLEKDE